MDKTENKQKAVQPGILRRDCFRIHIYEMSGFRNLPVADSAGLFQSSVVRMNAEHVHLSKARLAALTGNDQIAAGGVLGHLVGM